MILLKESGLEKMWIVRVNWYGRCLFLILKKLSGLASLFRRNDGINFGGIYPKQLSDFNLCGELDCARSDLSVRKACAVDLWILNHA